MTHNEEIDEWVRNKALRRALGEWMKERPWTYFGTVDPCPGLNTPEYLKSLRIWDSMVCRSVLKRRLKGLPGEDRPLTMAFFEGGPKSHNLHVHLLTCVPRALQPRYGPEVEEIWNGLAENSWCGRDLRLDPIGQTRKDQEMVVGYVTKNVAAPQHMVSWDFVP